MKRLQAFKFALMPSGQQERQMRRFAGSCRFVFNKALALQKERYEQGEKKLGYASLCKLLTEWRNSTKTAWLADAPVHPLQQTLKDLERAYTNFFAQRAGFPRFKKKGQHDSFRYPEKERMEARRPRWLERMRNDPNRQASRRCDSAWSRAPSGIDLLSAPVFWLGSRGVLHHQPFQIGRDGSVLRLRLLE